MLRKKTFVFTVCYCALLRFLFSEMRLPLKEKNSAAFQYTRHHEESETKISALGCLYRYIYKSAFCVIGITKKKK